MSAIEFTEEELSHEVSPLASFANVIRLIPERESAQRIASAIARRHGLEVEELLNGGRYPHLVRARRDVAVALREQRWSYSAIGRFLNRDHTSIMALVKGRPNRHPPPALEIVCA